MTELGLPPVPPRSLPGRALFSFAHGLAIVGGVLIALIVAMVVVSIFGRSLLSMPVYGDFELISIGTAIAVVLFLPHCHLQRGNVIVDLFLARAPEAVKLLCDAFASLLLGTMAGVLAWRSVLGGIDLYHSHDTSMILAIPVWWAFPFVALSLALLALCCLYTALRDTRRLFA